MRGPLGGLAWHHLQYVLGLARLGHEVHFIEDSDDYPSCYDPSRGVTDTDARYGLRFTAAAFDRVGLGDRWAYYDAHTSRWRGPCGDAALGLCARAEMLLNVSAVNPLRPWFLQVPTRALVDTDPVFTQVRHLTDPAARDRAAQHTCYFSFGENLASGRSSIPRDGLPWQATRQPIVLDVWPVTAGPSRGRFTSILQWDSYPAVEVGGARYGMKSDSFLPYWDLPKKAGPIFELAMGSPSAPRAELREAGWVVTDPLAPTRDPWSYQRHIQESKAEFGVAKQGYVVTRSGWFSERSAAYLASGRPVLVQETGFSDWLPGGAGVIPFSSPEEALAGIEELERDYAGHCRAARAVAEEHFDARKVLAHLLERAVGAR